MAHGLPGEDGVISGMRQRCDLYIHIDTAKALGGKYFRRLRFFFVDTKARVENDPPTFSIFTCLNHDYVLHFDNPPPPFVVFYFYQMESSFTGLRTM
jgi:hypothetical protein